MVGIDMVTTPFGFVIGKVPFSECGQVNKWPINQLLTNESWRIVWWRAKVDAPFAVGVESGLQAFSARLIGRFCPRWTESIAMTLLMGKGPFSCLPSGF